MTITTPTELAAALASDRPPLLLDVRRAQARAQSGQQIPGALWRDPALWLDWKDDLAQRSPVVLCCAHGKEISQSLTTALRVLGAQATCLEGGLAAWERQGHATEALPPPG